MAKVIGIISIKGGVGKTTATSNIAAALANQFGKKVLVVDANFSAPDLGLHLGVLETRKSIHDVLLRRSEVHEAVHNTEHGFDIIPAQRRGSGKIPHLDLTRYITKIKNKYDFVLVDSSPNLNQEMLATMIASDELLVVTTPDYPTLSATMHAVSVAKRRGTPITGLILNMVHNKKFELSTDEIQESAGAPVLAILPHDLRVLEALSVTRPASLHAPKSNAVNEYMKLAGAMVGVKFRENGFTAKLRRLFKKDFSKADINRELMISGIKD